MLCPTCKKWAARTGEQLSNLRDMAELPHFKLVCPDCDGTEWATTDRFVEDAPHHFVKHPNTQPRVIAIPVMIGILILLIWGFIKSWS